jgi:hypothetical protein
MEKENYEKDWKLLITARRNAMLSGLIVGASFGLAILSVPDNFGKLTASSSAPLAIIALFALLTLIANRYGQLFLTGTFTSATVLALLVASQDTRTYVVQILNSTYLGPLLIGLITIALLLILRS